MPQDARPNRRKKRLILDTLGGNAQRPEPRSHQIAIFGTDGGAIEIIDAEGNVTGIAGDSAELKAQTFQFTIDPVRDNRKTFYCHNNDGSFNVTLPNFTGRCSFDIVITTAAVAKFVAGTGATATYRMGDAIGTRKINAIDTITRVIGINGTWWVLNNMVAE